MTVVLALLAGTVIGSSVTARTLYRRLVITQDEVNYQSWRISAQRHALRLYELRRPGRRHIPADGAR